MNTIPAALSRVLATLVLSTIVVGSLPRAAGHAALVHRFDQDPAELGWQLFGSPSLFSWDASLESLSVRWDSSQGNSYWYHPLERPVTTANSFQFEVEFLMEQIALDDSWPGTFQIAMGLTRWADAVRPEFQRAVATSPRNLIEWNYFPAWGPFLPTLAAVVVLQDGTWRVNHDNLLELPTGSWCRLQLDFDAPTRVLRAQLFVEGVAYGVAQVVQLRDSDPSFLLDTVAISSYSDAGQEAPYFGRILANGWVRAIRFEVSPPPIAQLQIHPLATGEFLLRFQAQPGWRYQVESTSQLGQWTHVTQEVSMVSNPEILSIQIERDAATADGAFRLFRIVARKANP